MMLKTFILIFGIFAISRSYLRYKDRLLTLAAALFWTGLWVLIIASVLFKEWTSTFSQHLGVNRGADLLLFGAVLFLSYLSFRLYVRVEELRQELTRLIRALAIREAQRPDPQEPELETGYSVRQPTPLPLRAVPPQGD